MFAAFVTILFLKIVIVIEYVENQYVKIAAKYRIVLFVQHFVLHLSLFYSFVCFSWFPFQISTVSAIPHLCDQK